MSSFGVFFSHFLLLFATILYLNHPSFIHGFEEKQDKNVSMVMVPLMGVEEERGMFVLNETRRKLGSFQICSVCTCCGGSRGLCLKSPCCYAINCNVPNKPFGFCSFTPKTCNCFGCPI